MTTLNDQDVASLVRMPHTHDIVIIEDEVRKTYVSWDEDEPKREWAALHHLAIHAPDLAPLPLSQTTVDGRPSIVMSRIPGHPMTGTVSQDQQVALTDALRRLFAVPVPHGLPIRANDPVGFPQRFRPWLTEKYDLGQCQEPALVRRAIEAAVHWLQHCPADENWLVDPVLALGDGNLDNVMWDGSVARLIDWEEYGVSDLAYEVADVMEHASSRLERRLDVSSFLDAMELSAGQYERVEGHRRMFACFWLVMLLPGNGGWRRNPPGSTEDQARHLLGILK